MLLLSVVVDWMCYGKLVNVYYNFLEFNFLSDLGSFYGTHPWHWYLSQGLVVLLGSHIFPLLYAARKGIEPYFVAVIAWTILIYRYVGAMSLFYFFPEIKYCSQNCRDVGICVLNVSSISHQHHRLSQPKLSSYAPTVPTETRSELGTAVFKTIVVFRAANLITVAAQNLVNHLILFSTRIRTEFAYLLCVS